MEPELYIDNSGIAKEARLIPSTLGSLRSNFLEDQTPGCQGQV